MFLACTSLREPFHVKHQQPLPAIAGVIRVLPRGSSRKCIVAPPFGMEFSTKLSTAISTGESTGLRDTNPPTMLIERSPLLLQSHLWGRSSGEQTIIFVTISGACGPEFQGQQRSVLRQQTRATRVLWRISVPGGF